MPAAEVRAACAAYLNAINEFAEASAIHSRHEMDGMLPSHAELERYLDTELALDKARSFSPVSAGRVSEGSGC
jgi:hypothetical protein